GLPVPSLQQSDVRHNGAPTRPTITCRHGCGRTRTVGRSTAPPPFLLDRGLHLYCDRSGSYVHSLPDDRPPLLSPPASHLHQSLTPAANREWRTLAPAAAAAADYWNHRPRTVPNLNRGRGLLDHAHRVHLRYGLLWSLESAPLPGLSDREEWVATN